MPTDPKWRTIARASGQPISLVQAVYLHLLVSASRNVTRGHADVTLEDIASALDVTEAEVRSVFDAMQGRVLADFSLTGWETRQPKKEDAGDASTGAKSAAERKRDERARKAAIQDVTQSHDESRKVTLDKEEDKDKEEDSFTAVAKKKAAPRTLLPEGFAPNDAGSKAATDAGLNVAAELRRFRDHHESKGSLMANWQAAWRTWVGNAISYGRGKAPTTGDKSWLEETGFDSIEEASNFGCRPSTAHLFRNGQRIPEAA